MKTINIHEAKTHLSRLIDQAVKGDPFVIAKAGKPLVKVMALTTPKPDRLTHEPHALLGPVDRRAIGRTLPESLLTTQWGGVRLSLD